MNTNRDPMPRLDKTVMVVETLDTMTDDSTFWASQTPEARLAGLELLRRINYGDAATGRLQRVLEVVERNEVKYLLIGGYAVSYYGYVRTTSGTGRMDSTIRQEC